MEGTNSQTMAQYEKKGKVGGGEGLRITFIASLLA